MNSDLHKGRGRYSKKSQGKGGFSLLEVMIALVILAVGLLGLAALQITAIRGNAFSSEMTMAALFAQQKLEELRNMNFDDIVDGSETIPATEVTKGISFDINWTLKNPEDYNLPSDDYKVIELTVKWFGTHVKPSVGESEQQEDKVTFYTIISKY